MKRTLGYISAGLSERISEEHCKRILGIFLDGIHFKHITWNNFGRNTEGCTKEYLNKLLEETGRELKRNFKEITGRIVWKFLWRICSRFFFKISSKIFWKLKELVKKFVKKIHWLFYKWTFREISGGIFLFDNSFGFPLAIYLRIVLCCLSSVFSLKNPLTKKWGLLRNLVSNSLIFFIIPF